MALPHCVQFECQFVGSTLADCERYPVAQQQRNGNTISHIEAKFQVAFRSKQGDDDEFWILKPKVRSCTSPCFVLVAGNCTTFVPLAPNSVRPRPFVVAPCRFRETCRSHCVRLSEDWQCRLIDPCRARLSTCHCQRWRVLLALEQRVTSADPVLLVRKWTFFSGQAVCHKHKGSY